MKFVLEVDLSATATDGDAVGELGRILRYWAGNVRHYEVAAGVGDTVSDSAYRPVGSWRWEVVGSAPSGADPTR